MSVLTKNKSALYAKNTYCYQFKEFFENKDKEKVVLLTNKLSGKGVSIKLKDLVSKEEVLNKIEPTTAFELGYHMCDENKAMKC